MSLHYVVDNLDGVDAKYHDLYEQQNGKFVLKVEGAKPLTEFNTVHTALQKERDSHKATKLKLDGWNAIGTPDEVQTKLDRIAELELAAGGALDKAGIDKLVEARLAGVKAPLERQLTQAQKDIAERDAALATFKQEKTVRTIHDGLRAALGKHEGFQQSAFDDAAMLAERMFEVTDEGRVVTKDGVGVTPGLEPAVWLTEMQSRRPHWWGPTQGGGARGSQGGGGTGNNPWSNEGWNMTEQGRIIRENPQRAEQLAKSAGTSIGGLRPAARK